MEDTTIIILIVAAVVSIVLGVAVEKESGGWIEGTAILVAVVIVKKKIYFHPKNFKKKKISFFFQKVGFVTAGNEFSKEKQFRKLASVSNDIQVKVMRDGMQEVISTFDIMVGDIVILEAGDKICADGYVIDYDGKNKLFCKELWC